MRDVRIDLDSQLTRPSSRAQFGTEDARDLRATQVRLSHAEKILHDVNNFLLVIDFSCRQLLKSIPVESPLHSAVIAIDQARLQARELTRRHSESPTTVETPVSRIELNEVVRQTEQFVRPILNTDIILTTKLTTSSTAILADRVTISYLVMTLILNAANSIRQGGWITVTTEVNQDQSIDHPDSQQTLGQTVSLSITDTGERESCKRNSGLQDNSLERDQLPVAPIAQVSELIRSLGGNSSVMHSDESGTQILIRFSLVDQDAGVEVSDVPSQEFRGNETILLVDDEVLVRRLVTKILEDHGYTVIAVADEKSAIVEEINHSAQIKLLLADLNLSGISGQQVANQLRAINPNLQVVMMTGAAIGEEELIASEFICLQKPFDSNQLLSHVRQALDAHSGC